MFKLAPFFKDKNWNFSGRLQKKKSTCEITDTLTYIHILYTSIEKRCPNFGDRFVHRSAHTIDAYAEAA